MENLYWEKEYTDIYNGITFKFKQLNPIEHIALITKDIDYKDFNFDESQKYVNACLRNTLWSKDGINYVLLLDGEGNSKLPEFTSHPSIGYDLFCKFRLDVLTPVFLESRTFQNFLKAQKEELNK